MTEHFIIKCRECGTIVSQCRCPDLNKTVQLVTCKNCLTPVYHKPKPNEGKR